jgi:hypothetical protein
VVGFGLLCIPVHFIKVRRSFVGLLLGLGWTLAGIGALVLFTYATAAVLGVEP